MAKGLLFSAIAGVALAAFTIGAPVHAQEPKSIKIGCAISLTGPNAVGAATTILPNYRLWAKEVNVAGGIMLSSIRKRVPVEIIEYDDHSNLDDVIRGIDRLFTQDRADFLLPPWGTEFNVAAAPELVKRWPNTFWFLGTASGSAEAFVDILAKLHAEGKLGGKIAMVSVADQFGIGMARAARGLIKKNGLRLLYDRSYPVDLHDAGAMSADIRPIMTEVKQLNPDVFAAFSYPPDTMAVTGAARSLNFNPQIFYSAVGTAYPLYNRRFGDDIEAVMGIGGWNPDLPAARAYFEKHVALTGQEPDGWASPITYASLQMLQQAIERVGKIDRAAVIRELQTATFQTVVGPIKMKDNQYVGWYVGQWQNGKYYGIAPTTSPGARPILFPKPPWRAEQ